MTVQTIEELRQSLATLRRNTDRLAEKYEEKGGRLVHDLDHLSDEVSSVVQQVLEFIRQHHYTFNDEPYHVVKDTLLTTSASLVHVRNEKDQLDNFIDYLVDKMNGDRVDLMRAFLKELND